MNQRAPRDAHEQHRPAASSDSTASSTHAADEQTTQTDHESAGESTTGAAAAVDALEQGGANHLFGVQGGAIMPVYDELQGREDLDHITMVHEQGAAHAADAYGVVSGRPGICLATSGPGATNLVTGIADAAMDSDPLVALTGQVPTDAVGNDAFQETDTTGITAPIAKHTSFVGDPEATDDAVASALALAEQDRQGPVVVDLPKDVTSADRSESDLSTEAGSQPGHETQPPGADPAIVTAAADALLAAERPVVLAGGGVIKADASAALTAFAREHELPVVTTMPGLGSFPEDDQLSIGMAGTYGTGGANLALSHCDFLLAIGTRFSDRLTGDVETFAPNAAVAHIDIDPAEIGKNVHADYPLLGDAERALEQVAEALPDSPSCSPWLDRCCDWQAAYTKSADQSEGGPIDPRYAVECADASTPRDTIVTSGVGQHQLWACLHWEFTEPRTWISSHGLGTMGYGVPAAIGAKLAAPEQAVVCIEGDGSFLMTVQELSVAAREGLDITVIVLNNEAVGMVRQLQDCFYEGRHVASEYPWMPSLDKVGEAFGAKGFSVAAPAELEATIKRAVAHDGPSVIDVHVDPTADVFPMVPSDDSLARFALDQTELTGEQAQIEPADNRQQAGEPTEQRDRSTADDHRGDQFMEGHE